MSDRSSAEIFGEVFRMLASDPTVQHTAWAQKIWKMSDRYDFAPEQMHCEKALQKLGLARSGVDPDYPEDGTVWVYGGRKS